MTFGAFIFYILFMVVCVSWGFIICRMVDHYTLNAANAFEPIDEGPIEAHTEEYTSTEEIVAQDVAPIVNFPQEDNVILGVAHDG